MNFWSVAGASKIHKLIYRLPWRFGRPTAKLVEWNCNKPCLLNLEILARFMLILVVVLAHKSQVLLSFWLCCTSRNICSFPFCCSSLYIVVSWMYQRKIHILSIMFIEWSLRFWMRPICNVDWSLSISCMIYLDCLITQW